MMKNYKKIWPKIKMKIFKMLKMIIIIMFRIQNNKTNSNNKIHKKMINY